MQVNAINSFRSVNSVSALKSNNVNFEGKKNKNAVNNNGEKHSHALPLGAAAVLLPLSVLTSCNKDYSGVFDDMDETILKVHAEANGKFKRAPLDSVKIYYPVHDTTEVIVPYPVHDTTYVNVHDTTFVDRPIHDTTYVEITVPREFEIPKEIVIDSLNHWRSYLDIPADGDNGDVDPKENQIFMSAQALRDWEHRTPDYAKLDFMKSNKDKAVYNHLYIPPTGIKESDIEIVVAHRTANGNDKGIEVVKENGEVTKNVSGMLFKENDKKLFMHSNGRDAISVYEEIPEGEDNAGAFRFLGTVERGYLPYDGGTDNTQYRKNVLLNSIISPGTEDHYINTIVRTMNYDKLMDMLNGDEPDEQ